MNIKNIYKDIFRFDVEEMPLGIYNKFAKKYFIKPKIKLSFNRLSYKDCLHYPSILYVHSSDIGWKSKYGILEFEHEPYIDIVLFRTFNIKVVFKAPFENDDKNHFDVCYWESVLSMMDATDSVTGDWIKKEEDALFDAYENNMWTNDKHSYYSSYPYMTTLAKQILVKHVVS